MGCISTKAMLTPAGTVIVVVPGAGLAEATEFLDCESGCAAVVCCAQQFNEMNVIEMNIIEMNIRVLSARLCLIFVLVRNEKGRRRRFGDISDTS
jgi:hypothetical protein